MVDDGVKRGLISGCINEFQAHAIEFKRPMLNPTAFVVTGLVCFAIWGFYTWRLNSLGLEAGCGFPRHHARVDQASLKTSAVRALLCMPSP